MKRDKMEDLFDFLPKSKIKAADGMDKGKYPFYTSSETQSKYMDKYLYEPGCLVFGTGGEASVHLATRRFATSTDCLIIRPKPNAEIDVGYVFQYLKGNIEILERGFKGAGLKHISKGYISSIHIPYPEDIDDQKRIAHLLGKIEGLIAQRKRHLQQLDDLLKSVFLEMFGDSVRNEMGWDTSPVEELCTDVIDCPHSTPIYSDLVTGNYCVRSSDIVGGYLELNSAFQVEDAVYFDRIKRYEPQPDDIVYSREGGRLGNAARIVGSEKICLGQRMMLFKVSADNRSEFLWALLQSAAFKSKLRRLVGGGAAPRVNIKDIKKVVIIKPPVEQQDDFAKVVRRVDRIRDFFRQGLVELATLYGALSQKGFKNELDLSRIPLHHETEISDLVSAQDDLTVIHHVKKLDEYPMSDPQARKNLLRSLFEAYLKKLEGQSLSLEDFWQRANLKSLDLMDEADKPWNMDDYDQLKDWLFERIRDGRLEQTFVEEIKEIQLKAKT